MHVLFQIRPRLIIFSFLVNKSPALGISFNEVHQTPKCEFIQKKSFFPFSQCSLHGMTLESGFLPYPKLCLRSPTNKQQLLIFRSLKNDHVLAFCTNHGRCLPLSADAYMDNSEWDSRITMSPNVNRGELKRNGLSSATILGYYYSRLTSSVSHLLPPQPGECMRVSYFIDTLFTR